MGFIKKILLKLYYFKYQYCKNPFIGNKVYDLNFKLFNENLIKETKTKLDPQYKLRYYEILYYITKYKVRNVVELGTGRTSFIFNIISSIKCTSIEQDKGWLRKIISILKNFEIKHSIKFSNVVHYKNGIRFSHLPLLNPDLLYVDGPYSNKKKKKFQTFTGKYACYDFKTFFDRKVFPKIIMIEGRTDTADAILESPYSKKYWFKGEFAYYFQRNKLLSSISFRRHSIFIRKN